MITHCRIKVKNNLSKDKEKPLIQVVYLVKFPLYCSYSFSKNIDKRIKEWFKLNVKVFF